MDVCHVCYTTGLAFGHRPESWRSQSLAFTEALTWYICLLPRLDLDMVRGHVGYIPWRNSNPIIRELMSLSRACRTISLAMTSDLHYELFIIGGMFVLASTLL